MNKLRKYFYTVLVIMLFLFSNQALAANCPSGYTKSGNYCCNNLYEVPVSGLFVSYCQTIQAKCEAAPSNGKFCSAADKSTCCYKQDSCGVSSNYGVETAVCVPPKPTSANCPGGSSLAGMTKDGKQVWCCNATEERGALTAKYPTYPYCQPKGSAGGTCKLMGQPGKIAKGLAGTDYANDKRCCIDGSIPSVHPNGMPYCQYNAKTAANSYHLPGAPWAQLSQAINANLNIPPNNPTPVPTNPNTPVPTGPSTPAANPIRADLVVNLPRGGEVWPIGSTKEINWSETNYTYSPGLYKIYASTRDGSWYGLINQTGEPSINWQVGKVTVNGVTKTLSPGNYWIQVIKQDGQLNPDGSARTQAMSAGSVELVRSTSGLGQFSWLASVWQAFLNL